MVVDGHTLALLLEGEFSLLIVVLVLASTPILTTLFSPTLVLPFRIHQRLRSPPTFPLFFGISVSQALFSLAVAVVRLRCLVSTPVYSRSQCKVGEEENFRSKEAVLRVPAKKYDTARPACHLTLFGWWVAVGSEAVDPCIQTHFTRAPFHMPSTTSTTTTTSSSTCPSPLQQKPQQTTSPKI